MDWLAEIDKITQSFKDKSRHLNEKDLNWKPNPQTWNIAQNIGHLIVANETYFSVLTSLKEGTYKTPFPAKPGFMVSFPGKTVLNAVEPDKNKIIGKWEFPNQN